jgi:hypothetical protein
MIDRIPKNSLVKIIETFKGRGMLFSYDIPDEMVRPRLGADCVHWQYVLDTLIPAGLIKLTTLVESEDQELHFSVYRLTFKGLWYLYPYMDKTL